MVSELGWEEDERRVLPVERGAGLSQFLELGFFGEYLHGVVVFRVIGGGVRMIDDSLLARCG